MMDDDQKQTDQPPKTPFLSLQDNEQTAGMFFLHNWKKEHMRTVWANMTIENTSKIQLRLATILTFILLLFHIGLALAQASADSKVQFWTVSFSISSYMILLVWAASLSQKHAWQNKAGCFLFFFQYIIDSFVWVTDPEFEIKIILVIIYFIVTPILACCLYALFRNMARAVQLGRTKKEMIGISTSLFGKIVASLPLMFYLTSNLISKAFAWANALYALCELEPGATLEQDVVIHGRFNPQSVWRNCTFKKEFHYPLNETLKPASMTTAEVQLKLAVTKHSALAAAEVSTLFQSLEVSLVILTSIMLIRVRHKSIKDVFALQITLSELFLCIVTIVRVSTVAVLSGLSIEYMSVSAFDAMFGTLQWCWIVCAILTGLNLCWLVYRTIKSFKKDTCNSKVLPSTTTNNNKKNNKEIRKWN